MMSLACAHCPAMLGWPSAVLGGLQFGSSFGGFLGSIHPGGGGFFGGGGPCAATRTTVTATIVAVRITAINAPTNVLLISASLRRGRMELVVKRVALVLQQLNVRFPVAVQDHT